jgi:putative beta-lysine N-acetyltransferase
MGDRIETIAGSVIQHGAHSNRIYLIKLNTQAVADQIATLDDMARRNGYGKIFAKIPAASWPPFAQAGYTREAVVPGFFNGHTDGLFIAKYHTVARKHSRQTEEIKMLLQQVTQAPLTDAWQNDPGLPEPVLCQSEDIVELCAIYRQVFQTYPFPIDQPQYLGEAMHADTDYFCIRIKGQVAAVAAAEMDPVSQTVEMTDFATLPRYRGRGLAGKLLRHMDRQADRRGFKTAYTIARATSYGMNAVFYKNGYRYAGLLVNNTQIAGAIRDMTVWYKTF